MADEIFTTKEERKEYPKHPEGTFLARCVDVIDLGEKVSDFAGKDKKLQRRVAFVFRTGEKDPHGNPMDVAKEFALSMFKRSQDAQAPLRKFLEQWRGKPYPDDDAAANVPLHKLEGHVGVVTVAHEPWKSDPSKVNAVLMSVTPVMQGTKVPTFNPYERAEFWTKRKAKYAADAKAFRDEIGAPREEEHAGDDDLPF